MNKRQEIHVVQRLAFMDGKYKAGEYYYVVTKLVNYRGLRIDAQLTETELDDYIVEDDINVTVTG